MKLSEEAIELIEQAATTTPLECLEKIKVSLRKLNKFIKIVSKSSASSKTIQQYKTDGLAKDSEDNRRIRGAEKNVIEKLKTVVNNPIIRRNPTEFSTISMNPEISLSTSCIKPSIPYIAASRLSKFAGSLVSTKFVLSDIIQLKNRYLFSATEEQIFGDSKLNILLNKRTIKCHKISRGGKKYRVQH